jgi:hypothetical protein
MVNEVKITPATAGQVKMKTPSAKRALQTTATVSLPPVYPMLPLARRLRVSPPRRAGLVIFSRRLHQSTRKSVYRAFRQGEDVESRIAFVSCGGFK